MSLCFSVVFNLFFLRVRENVVIEEEFRSQNGLIAPLSLTGVRINTSLREAAPTTDSVQVSGGFRPATD